MRRKICLAIAMIMSAVALTACGSSSDNTSTTAETTTAAAAADEATTAAAAASSTDQYAFTYKGTVISMKADAASIIEALGEPKSYTEETSCAFEGLDKNYTYTSFILTTYPDGDTDRVNSLTLKDDTVSTADGICIGDSKDKVEEVYGADAFNGVNAYIITETDASLTVILENDKVSSIQYNAVFE